MLTTAVNQLGGFLSGFNVDPSTGFAVNSPAFQSFINSPEIDPTAMHAIMSQTAISPNADFTGGPAGQAAAVGGTFGAGMSAAPSQAGGRGGTGVEGVVGAIGPTVARSGQTDPPGETGPAGPAGVGNSGIGEAGVGGTTADSSSPAGVGGEASGSGPGGAGGAGGSGGDSLLCNYALNGGACSDKEASTHRRNFGALAERAFRQHPALKESFGHYQNVAGQIIGKIEGMDQARRKAAVRDLGTNIVTPFAAAAKKGDIMGAGRILRSQTMRLAKQHGVKIPQAHIAASEGVLGPVGEG
jgi:hypothetical protein